MKELQRKHRLRRFLYSAPSVILLFVLTLLVAKGAVALLQKERLSSIQAEAFKKEILALTTREQELKDSIKNLGTEEGIKEEIRKRYSVTEDGEHLAIIVEGRSAATSSDKSTRPWYKKLLAVIIPFYE